MYKYALAALMAALMLTRGASAAAISEVEANDTLATAQNVDGNFTLDFDANIGDMVSNTSNSLAHVTVNGTGTNNFDFFKFTVMTAGSKGIFDIDFAFNGDPFTDMSMHLFKADGSFLASNHTSNIAFGALGSTSEKDPYLEYVFATPGQYVIALAQEFATPLTGGRLGGSGVKPGTVYALQISVPEPSQAILAALGLIGLCLFQKRR